MLKCDYSFLCKFPMFFSKVKVKLGHNFSLFIHRFKIWIFICWPLAVYTFTLENWDVYIA